MDKPITIYGKSGTGSVIVEAALTLIGAPYQVVDQPELADGRPDGVVNAMRQVPAMVLPGGEVMTESAAILIWLADQYPEAHLAPALSSRRLVAYLRWMMFVSAQIYALFWIRDDLSRLAADVAHEAVLKDRTAERIATCWRMMDSQVTPRAFLLGDEISVLDLYVTVVSRWGPRRKRFYAEAPKMAEVVRRVDAEPALQALWAERYPFIEGWEG